MNDIFRYFLGLGVIIGLVVFYAWIKTFSEFKEAKEKQIKADVAEFGQCCGLESGVCTLPARLEKLNKIELHAAKKEPNKK
jgi:uncharacterized membrane protein YjfL (UPF0719 family)